ncbi:FtsK/SpoIIIE domain-containing protein [Jidongwangia harbinensis]|uniref:FtsK/SpoIIIE domain-containing protein n=1 Tax=Jidongwangia harbinensis TaxID=2878561 RepID=UPI001CD9A025|nr:FtsK/SpoIIIE domain-containing protein [Jidongwangia harbinensis]MCA2213569.1 cell division protein FtsK [Jidongwangia harbinensis]
MGSHRNALVAAVRQELAEARGTARAVLAAAETARAEAQRRRRVVREAYSTCLAQLAEARDTARTDILRRYRTESAALASNAGTVAALCAPGAAGTPWRMWSPTEPERGARTGLLRIGTITLEHVTIPGLVPLLDGAHLSLDGDPAQVDGVISGVLLRALGTTRPGEVRLTVYDPERLGGTLAPFAPLGLSFVGPGGLGAMLDDLVEHICRVNESVLAGEHASLAALTAATTGPRPEPWRVVVLLADPDGAEELTPAQRAQLNRIVRTGVACGVHLIVRGIDLPAHPTVERIVVRDGAAVCDTAGDLTVRLDPPPPADRITAFCRSVAERLRAGPPPARLADLIPDKLWTECSAHELSAPVGDCTDGSLVEVLLGDDPPHALIGGPSGSGKTNLIYAWLGSMTARYGPDELALYLLDFKEGVSFARFTPGPRDPSWLPQVRLAGINVNGDREFGLAMLRHLGEELRARALAAKRHDATKLAELRVEDPAGHWPRIVAVIDEFQVLLAGRDAVAEEAVTLLEDLARRGRSQGIHLVLASQDVSGIEALWGRSGLIGQFTLRIALPKARRVLADTNLAAAVIPRFHAVVNADSGVAGANRIVRLPDAGDRSAWQGLQRRQWRQRPDGWAPPRLFDGDAVPRLPEAYRPAGRPAGEPTTVGSSPGAVLGERIDVAARPARLRLGRMPGRNLAVLGTRTDEACDILAAAALSLAAQGPAHFSVACLEPGAEHAAARLVAELPEADWYGAADLTDLFQVPPDGIPHYVLGYGLDSAGPEHRAALRTMLTHGPEQRTHVLGWWRSVARLRDDLGGPGARFDAIGGWVALDVHGAELGPLCPQPGGPVWYPRPRRALFFDRSVHRFPEVIIPYEVNSDHA